VLIRPVREMLILQLITLAAACPPCGCHSFLQKGRGDPPAGQFGSPVDPLATEAAALKKGTSGDAAAVAESVEMATTDPKLVALFVEDPTSFEGRVKNAVSLALNVPVERLTVTPMSKLALMQGKAVQAAMWLLTIAPLPPANVTAAANATNASTVVCPPCPCPVVAAAALPFDLPGDIAAALPPPPAKPTAKALASELLLMVRSPTSPLNALLPGTTARAPGGLFPRPDPTSVALGSRSDGPTPADEAMAINEETQKMVSAMRTQLQEANEARAWILQHGIEAPTSNGKLPLPSEDTDPWSAMADDSMLGQANKNH